VAGSWQIHPALADPADPAAPHDARVIEVTDSFSAVLALKRKTTLEAADLIPALRLFVEPSGARVTAARRSRREVEPVQPGLMARILRRGRPITFDLDGVRMRVSLINRPFRGRDGMRGFVNPAVWADGLAPLVDHRAHVLIEETGVDDEEEGPDEVFDRAAAVTATAFVVAGLTAPAGAIWLPARNAIPLSTLSEEMDGLIAGHAPLRLWMRWQVIAPAPRQDACPGLVTSGLAPLIGREIVAWPSRVETHRQVENVIALARRLIDEGVEIVAKKHLAVGGDTHLSVRLRATTPEDDVPVFEVAVPGSEPPPPAEEIPDPFTLPSLPTSRSAGEPEPGASGGGGVAVPPPALESGAEGPACPTQASPDKGSLTGGEAGPGHIPAEKQPCPASGFPNTAGSRDYVTSGGRRIRVIPGGNTQSRGAA